MRTCSEALLFVQPYLYNEREYHSKADGFLNFKIMSLHDAIHFAASIFTANRQMQITASCL